MKIFLSTFLFATLCSILLAAPASAAGVGETCGGIASIQCDAGLLCQYPMNQCDVADLGGKCVQADSCSAEGPAVCGCDGKTYANECEIMRAGVIPARNGKC